MSKNDFDPAQTQADLWIIGHAGHGKTTLAAAIDRATQARRCVKIGDAPTPPERVKAAILVVSAAEGPMPQTRDHLKIARQAGVPVVVVFLNKIDAADKSLTPLVEMEIRELMTLCGYAGDKAAIVRGSASLALKGDESDIGMPSIRRLLDALGEGRAIVAQNPAAEPNPSVSKSGGWGESILRLFSR